MNTSFKVDYVFRVTDRGMVLAGTITGGEISAGDMVEIDEGQNEFRVGIKSVEEIRDISHKVNIRLILDPVDQRQQQTLRNLDGRTLTVVKAK